jgi:hypothetical protein
MRLLIPSKIVGKDKFGKGGEGDLGRYFCDAQKLQNKEVI